MTMSRLLRAAGLVPAAFLSVYLVAGPLPVGAHPLGDRPPMHDHAPEQVTGEELRRFAAVLNEIAAALEDESAARDGSSVRTVSEGRLIEILDRHGLTPSAFNRIHHAVRHDRELARRVRTLRQEQVEQD